jgi:hypothetical protein
VEGAGLAAVFLAGLCKSWDAAQYVRYTPENNYSIIKYSNTIKRKKCPDILVYLWIALWLVVL